jgi:hypothetical protein
LVVEMVGEVCKGGKAGLQEEEALVTQTTGTDWRSCPELLAGV